MTASWTACIAFACMAAAACTDIDSHQGTLMLAATHTLDDSGLLDTLALGFHRAHPELRLRVAVSGTYEALEHARRGLADVTLTHAVPAEQEALEEGFVVSRRELMFNSFIIAGPPADPAGIRGSDAVTAFARISDSGERFVSRDDRSGTHMRELDLWRAAEREPPEGCAYIRAGLGMADALRLADTRDAYILTDSATFIVLEHALILVPLVASDTRLLNSYAVMRARSPRDTAAARVLIEWLHGPEMRAMITRFGGGGMFTPTAAASAPVTGKRADTLSGTGP